MLGRCCLCTPPVPFPGFIRRYLYPTAIADYNSLSNTTYTAEQYYTDVAKNFSTSTFYYGGKLLNCLSYTMTIPATATSRQSAILQPVRFTIDETSTNGGTLDYWKSSSGFLRRAIDAQYQAFASDELLPASGNSHVSDNDPPNINYANDLTSGLYDLWKQTSGYEFTGRVFAPPLPRNFEVRPRYVQIRKNGAAYGNLYDLEDFNDNRESSIGLQKYVTQNTILFSGSPNFNSSYWNVFTFQFSAGDTAELDVWFEVVADPDPNQIVTKYVPVSIGQNDNASSSHAGHDTDSSWVPAGAVLLGANPLASAAMQVSGLDMSDGYDPSADTYTYTADDGTAVMGKALSSDAIQFATDSGSLLWYFSRTIAGTPQPGTGSSTWQSDNGDPWELVTDNCTTGDPVEPEDNPPDPTDPPTNTIADGGCELPAQSRTLYVYLLHIWREEMSYLAVSWYLDGNDYTSATGWHTTVYRPANASPTPDYATQVYSNRDANDLTVGFAGCFAHLGSTVYKMILYADGTLPQVQTGTTHSNGHSQLPSDLQAIVPTSITAVHGTQ